MDNPDRPLGFQTLCLQCKELIEWREIRSEDGKHAVRYWSDCRCWLAEIARVAGFSAASSEYQVNVRVGAEQIADVRAYQGFTIDTFDASRLTDGRKLVRAATRWLDKIMAAPACDQDFGSPARCCLYFYSPGKGRGKTHLASAIALEARRRGKSISIFEEMDLLGRYWGTPIEQRYDLLRMPGESAFLTVMDDMGARENTPAGLRDFWADITKPRWLGRGWTIITSNHTLAELLDNGTIDERAYSRLMQMTQGEKVTFEGADQRLAFTQEMAA